MPTKTWVLINTADDTYDFDIAVKPDQVGGKAKGYEIEASVLQGGLRDNVETVEIDNGTCKFTVVPTRGMGIWKAWLGDTQFGWNSPVKGPVHPSFVNVGEPSGLGWLDGFDELLVRCGLHSNGAPDFNEKGILTYPLHGRIANLPAHRLEMMVDGDSGEITLAGVVEESRFNFKNLRLTSTIKTKVGESVGCARRGANAISRQFRPAAARSGCEVGCARQNDCPPQRPRRHGNRQVGELRQRHCGGAGAGVFL
jgi:hypothetical protein